MDNYGLVTVPVLDRIQKRPIYLYPGYPLEDKKPNSLTVGSVGCNNRCPFCQNWEISQVKEWDGLKEYLPKQLVDLAVLNGMDFISFTFNEPAIMYEYIKDTHDAILNTESKKANKLKICMKTAGYISEEYWNIFPIFSQIFNVDIKPMDSDYEKKCGIMDSNIVLGFIKAIHKSGRHLEISHILIEGVNDNEKCISKLMQFVGKMNPNIGIHLLKHYPAWKSDYPLTKDKTIETWGNYLKKGGLKNVFTNDVG